MVKFVEGFYLSYAQFCVFQSSLDQPYNDWSDRSYTQGFAWRVGSVSFRALVEEGYHKVNIFIGEGEPELTSEVVRAIKVPFTVKGGNIEIGSISDTIPLELPDGDYAIRVEFISSLVDEAHEINIRLNKGCCAFELVKADAEIVTQGDYDVKAMPAT
ncbi:hypothetical protein DN824_09235 [Stutzerimonas nosocomialis]|uniref:competence protein ComJ n=1 Tax=Stutzerimonas nosocomialis TaxID=1056496 RepID=UPI00110904E9|nr:competence protein ComJ [Stutzerimonas nosocomialis]TLX58760.1 hypothetical protein DN824_09235 [Stutzerimonas nosocomialis]